MRFRTDHTTVKYLKSVKRLQGITAEETSHGGTKKWVLKSNNELDNSLTQIAFGRFEKDESCPVHVHPTMDEYFFILNGKGTYIIGEEMVDLEPNMLIEIPAGTEHQLLADKDNHLEFIYWGVAKSES